MLTGIWHGAAFTYIAWGIWHGIFNLTEKFIKSHSKSKEVTGRNFKRVIVSVFQHVYTMLVVMLGWVMFRSSGIKHAFNYIKSLFGLNNPETSVYNVWLYLNKWSFLILILGLIMCTPLLKKLYGLLKRKVNEKILTPVKYILLLALLLLCVLQVASNSYSAFIYFQF